MTTETPRNLPRSIGAFFAGLAVNFIGATAIDAILHATGVFPPFEKTVTEMTDELYVLALSYRLFFGVAGSALTAKLAPRRPMKHALFLGGVGTVLSITGAIAMWQLGHNWYPILLAVSALPCSWLGGRFVTDSKLS